MAETVSEPSSKGVDWLGPWPTSILSVGLAALAALLRTGPWSFLTPACLPLVVVAVLLAGRAVARSLKQFREDWDTRLEVGSLLGLVSLVPLLCYSAMASVPDPPYVKAAREKVAAAPDNLLLQIQLEQVEASRENQANWDSGRMLMTALLVVSVAGALLVLAPRIIRLVTISLLIVIHFGGILDAVVSVDPPGQSAPWLATRAWVNFYRPYLGFMYLNNAYHFYSPEPGPPTLIWSYVVYTDGENYRGRWIKMPDKETSPVPLHHQRGLSLAEGINQLAPVVSDADERFKRRNTVVAPRGFEAGNVAWNAQLLREPGLIPYHPNSLPTQQCVEPSPYSKEITRAFARHLARVYPTLKDHPEYKFHSVKIYRVRHECLTQAEMAQGFSPLDKTLYFAYYQGEFDVEGNLKKEKDPCLYWLIPIVRDYQTDPETKLYLPPTDPNDGLYDFLQKHAEMRP